MDFQELLLKVAKILQDLKIPYAVTGGYAVSIWGRLRSTYDIDIVIEIFDTQIKTLHQALREISKLIYVDDGTKKWFNFIHGESGIKVDFFIVSEEDKVSKLELERRVPQIIENQTVYFVSPEDLILSKLRWYKEGESFKQLEDINSIFKIQKKLDLDYLKKQAKVQSTTKILKSLLNKAN